MKISTMPTMIATSVAALSLGAVLVAYDLGSRRSFNRSELGMSGYDGARPYVTAINQPLVDERALENSLVVAGGQVAVSCEPFQRAVMRERILQGARLTEIACVSQESLGGPSYAPSSYVGAPRLVPVAANPVRAVVRERVVARAPERVAQSSRSWQKSALLIGGSAGTGAGVGAIIGGKKGALAGAVIGGGAAAIYDQTKRR